MTNIQHLSNLLVPRDEQDTSADFEVDSPLFQTVIETPKAPQRNSNAIWDADEVDTYEYQNNDIEEQDDRSVPEYDIIYKQKVTSEDNYFNSSHKTPGSESCEKIMVKIKLPKDNLNFMTLDIQRDHLTLRSSLHKLVVNFPVQIKDKEGNATWDKATETLCVTLLCH